MNHVSRRDFLRSGAGGAAALWLPFAPAARSASWHARAARSRVSPRALRELRRALRGKLILPGDALYPEASLPDNSEFDHIKPIGVAECADEQDVITCIEWAREHRVPPVAKGGGHSYAGYSTNEGLVVQLHNFRSVAPIDPDTGQTTVGGSARNQDVLAAEDGHDYVLPAGTCLSVGVGGLVLGGGIGYNTRWGGLTADHLVATRMVLADGRVVHVDSKHHPDLFWACRGGAGGSFGINTQFTFRFPRVPRPEVAFYRFEWRGADAAAAVFRAFDHILATAWPRFNAVASAQAVEVGSGGADQAISMFSRGQYIGPLSELEALVQPLIDAATPTSKTLRTYKYWDAQKVFAGGPPPHHGFGDISRYSKAPLPDAVYGRIATLLAECPSRDKENNGSMWSMGWVGGAANDLGRHETAYVHRGGMISLLRATPVWSAKASPSVVSGLKAWTQEMIDLVAPYTPAESYQNFPNRDIKDWRREYYAENYERLVRVKHHYDPHNVFHNAQSIR